MSNPVRLPPPVYLFSPFSEGEWDVLGRFERKVRFLQESEFPGASLDIKLVPVPAPGPGGGQGWAIGIDRPDEREVKSIIGDFRQIYTDSNRSSARSVLKMLRGHARDRDTDASQSLFHQLKAFGKHLGHRKENDPRGYVLEGTPDEESVKRSPDSIVKAWFNGVYFHDDELGSPLGLERDGHASVEMFRWHLQTAIKDFISDWGKLRYLVEAILRDPALRR
ncbi:MAG: hypothetical protein ACTHO8_10220 [Solirubrobacterales bacterium]